MSKTNGSFNLKVDNTTAVCPAGEAAGEKMMAEGKIPVISCEGACIRGEIARVAAHMVAKEEPYRRSCHGEFFTAPDSAIAEWANRADKVIVIDGCFMHCHGRLAKNLVDEKKVAIFDALSFYKKYSDLMDIDDVPEDERKETARLVADNVLDAMENGLATACVEKTVESSYCCGSTQESKSSCGSNSC